ncbi:MAG: hypothetical protein WBQ21_06250 [Solirubrobacteraceae bacterium]
MTSTGSNLNRGPLLPRWRGWLILIPGIFIAGFVASVLHGVPAKLPGVALGFPVLLDLERAGAVLAVAAVVSIFAYMTSLGHLPSQVGNVIGYPAADRQHELERWTEELDQRIEQRLAPLEEGQRVSDEMLPIITEQLSVLNCRVREIGRPE